MDISIPVGSKLQVKKIIDKEEFWREGEVLAVRSNGNIHEFYIHYTNFNKRLDEWVPLDRLDLKTLQLNNTNNSNNANNNNTNTSTTNTKGGTKRGNRRKQQQQQQQQQVVVVSLPSTDSTMAVDEKMEIIQQQPTEEEEEESKEKAKVEEIESLRRGGSMTNRPEEVHRVKNINAIVIGKHRIETWYFSPYPPELSFVDTIFLCDFCLSFYDSKTRLQRHREKCNLYHPPGNEIYRKDDISFFEIDGNKQRTYARNLCLLSKLFLDHKTLYYDVNPFLFYVMTFNDQHGHHLVGYFSKEKESLDNYNVACILTLPNQQRKGYGRLLINFSYELSKKEGKLGSPEKPLSDLGLLSYRTYWSEVLLEYFYNTMESEISIEDLSAYTSMTNEDVLHTLQSLDVLRYYNGQYIIVLSERHKEMYEKYSRKKRVLIDPNALDWKPPVFSASQLRYL